MLKLKRIIIDVEKSINLKLIKRVKVIVKNQKVIINISDNK